MHTENSPRGNFTVEEYSCGEDGTAVCLRGPDGSKTQLYARPGSIIEPYVYVSPDERWIVCVQKLYHGVSAAWLYERSASLQYREIGPPRFSEAAWQFFHQQTHSGFTQSNHFTIHAGGWQPDGRSMLVELDGDDGRVVVAGWSCYSDLQKHRFLLDPALKRKNKNTITTHKQT